MENINTLREDILKFIKNDNYDVVDLCNMLNISNHTNDSIFANNLTQIVTIIITDRDANDKFDLNDLKLMSNDIIALTSLTTSILLLMASSPTFKLKNSVEQSEELVFKLLVYIFLVAVPKQMNRVWSYDEKRNVVELILLAFQLIEASQIAKEVAGKISILRKSSGLCSCIRTKNKEDLLNDKISIANRELTLSMNNIREKVEMQNKVNALEKKIRKIKSVKTVK